MAITNHERVGKMLELLRDRLAPFAEREWKTCWGEKRAQEFTDPLCDMRHHQCTPAAPTEEQGNPL